MTNNARIYHNEIPLLGHFSYGHPTFMTTRDFKSIVEVTRGINIACVM